MCWGGGAREEARLSGRYARCGSIQVIVDIDDGQLTQMERESDRLESVVSVMFDVDFRYR